MPSNTLPPGVAQGLFDALAQSTVYFDGRGQSGDWSNAGNWWNGVPTATSNVLVPVSTTLNGSFAAKSVMLLGTETVTFNGTLTTNSTNLCESFMVCSSAHAIFDPGSVLNDAGSFIVGNLDHGTLTALGNASSHAALHSTGATIGRASSGIGTVTIDGAHWTNSNSMIVGQCGQGALTITGDGVVSVGANVTVGCNAGATGQVTVADGGMLAVNATLSVGNALNGPMGAGTGTLTVGANGLVTAGFALNVHGGDTLAMAGGTIRFGAYANGLSIAANGHLSGFGTIAAPASGTITDSGTIVASGGTLLLDSRVYGAGGLLDIAGGATLDIQASAIGQVTIDFTGGNGVLDLAHGIADAGVIADFAAGDRIVTSGVNGLSYNAATGYLSLTENGAAVDKLHFAGTYASDAFTLAQSGANAVITVASGPTVSPATTPAVNAVPAQHATPALPPGVSLGLFDALAQSTVYFDGRGQSGDWSNAGNWWNGVPTATSNVLVPVSTTLNGSFAAKSVMLLGTETVTFNGTLTTNSTNLCESFMVCSSAHAIFDPGSVLNDAGSFIVGNLDHGTLTALGNASSHAALHSTGATIGRASSGIGTVTIDGAHWTNSNSMIVGQCGQGALTITGDGVVSVGANVTVGCNAGATGQVTVADGGMLAVNATLSVGNALNGPMGAGTGTLTVGANGLVTAGFALNVHGGDTLAMAGGTIRFGAYANGLSIAANGHLSGFGTIAAPASGTITDSGTIVASGGTLLLDSRVYGAGGLLDIAGGATLDIQASAIGQVTIDFTGGNGVLDLAHGIADAGVIADFAAGDRIVTSGVNGLSYNAATGYLSLTENGAAVDKLHFAGTYASDAFTLAQSGANAVITVAHH